VNPARSRRHPTLAARGARHHRLLVGYWLLYLAIPAVRDRAIPDRANFADRRRLRETLSGIPAVVRVVDAHLGEHAH
jgi:hypothetical protein